MRKLLTLIIGFLLAGTVLATDGFTFRDGFWYDAQGTPHLRYKSWWQSRSAYSSTWQWRWDYERVVSPHVQATPIDPLDARLMDLLQARDRAEILQRDLVQRHNAFLEKFHAAGLGGNFRLNGYGAIPPGFAMNPYAGNLQLGSFGANGNTIYGYSLQSAIDYANREDYLIGQQAASRHAELSLELGKDSVKGHRDLVAQQGANQARVAEHLAKFEGFGRAFANAMKSLEPQGVRVEQRLSTFQSEPKLKSNGLAALATDCTGCHSGPKARAGFDVADIPSFDLDARKEIWERLTTKDAKRLMPRGRDGHGVALSKQKLAGWAVVLFGQ